MASRKASQLDLPAPKVLVSCEGAKLNQSVSLQGGVKVQVKTIVGEGPDEELWEGGDEPSLTNNPHER